MGYLPKLIFRLCGPGSFPTRRGYDLLFRVDMVNLSVGGCVVAAWSEKSCLGLAEISSTVCLI